MPTSNASGAPAQSGRKIVSAAQTCGASALRYSGRRARGGWIGWATATLTALYSLQPFSGTLPRGHDTLLHLYRIPILNAMWRQGILFSRWTPELMLGYGYPLFTFYPPLSSFMIGALYWILGQNAPAAMAVAFVVSAALATAGMYLLGRMVYGATGAALCTAAYLLSPHVLYQTYHRGSISNALAMGLFPLALYALLRYTQMPSPVRAIAPAMALAGVLTSHAAASLVFVPVLAVLGMVAAYGRPANRLPWAGRLGPLLLVAAPLALGFGLGAFSWLPALLEVETIRYAEAVAAPDVHWGLHSARALSWPPAAIDGLANADLDQSAGLVVLALGALGMARAALGIWRAVRHGGVVHDTDLIAASAGVLGLGAVFLASPASALLWEHSEFVRNLQFPWRCLDAAAICLALSAGRLPRGWRRTWPWRAALLAGSCVALALNALPYMAPPRHAGLPERPTLADASDYQLTYGALGLTSWGEYLPSTATWIPDEAQSAHSGNGVGLHEKVDVARLPQGALLAAGGDPWHALLELSLPYPQIVTVRTYCFAGWQARIDGVRVPLEPDSKGLLTVDVPAGRHTLEIRWGYTPLRKAADGLTLLSATIVLIGLVRGGMARRKHHPSTKGTRARRQEAAYVPWDRQSLPLMGMALTLLVLVIGKTLVLDHRDSPLLRHVGPGGLRGVAAPPWGIVEDQLRLVGYETNTAGDVTLYWRTLQTMVDDYVTAVEARDMRGVPLAATRNTHPGLSLTSRWLAGDLVRDAHHSRLPDIEPPFAIQLVVQVLDPVTKESLTLSDGPTSGIRDIPIGILRFPAQEERAAEVGSRVGVVFGGALELERAALPAEASAGSPIEYTLVWRGHAPVTHDYTVFVHVLDGAGTLVATDDGQPLEGLYPTSVWESGEVVVDARVLAHDLGPGAYRVVLGWYSLETGERLEGRAADGALADHVELGVVHVR